METLKLHLGNYGASVTGQSVREGERRTRGRSVKDWNDRQERKREDSDLHEDQSKALSVSPHLLPSVGWKSFHIPPNPIMSEMKQIFF